ncbi:MAG: signal peptidase I [Candidatus Berkelbacteria bacterium Licking1014_96]|uniref:Signal peptidase I n=1 Tax=Candidatus Berkelbacteria bacterium Licking1014_96 TaxID=2017149 RepID=A0A554LH37_9BACT|nr:MAG: signal peptidase I [Candidatus Berkelbacteria bacterium Licking1014_96]
MREEYLVSKSTRNFFVIFDYLRTALVIVVGLLLIYYLVAQVFVIKGVSMDPNFADGELILVNRLSYYFISPSRGDSVVFIFPGTRSDRYIKRIIALPRETVQISNNEIKINGRRLKEDYLPADFKTLGETNLKLKNDQFFVLGDNRELSNDSRVWGSLEKDKIIGRAQFIFYPFSKIKWLERASYNI